ncbi:PREDICTED: cadherin-5 [Myotis brandtii]|uniref:cadherin-5 n=1 Tax=Myotis brandtii TaxID=109478 RepID=UPI0007041F4D|nr:PREDICTED: cadherin-5 [Myotis brandtii]
MSLEFGHLLGCAESSLSPRRLQGTALEEASCPAPRKPASLWAGALVPRLPTRLLALNHPRGCRSVPPGKMHLPLILLATAGTCLGLLMAAAAGTHPAQLDTPSRLLTHQRQKRHWIWNQMHIEEEKNSSLPHHVGKIISSENRKNTKYVLRGEAADKIFRVNEVTGDVFAFERLDREKTSQYHLTALIVDKNTNKELEPPSNFLIKVYDVNDNWPVFTHQFFNASVSEMSAAGTSVFQLTAVDADDPTVAEHTTVMYHILKGDEYFGISNSGLVFTKVNNLDRETQAKYEIVVEAQDAQGLRGDSGTTTVLITLEDINDNFPIFTKTNYNFTVPEDIRVGSPLGSLFVEDPDEPQHRMTKYSIVQGEFRDTFTIQTDPAHNEGIIKPTKPLDYERIQQYSFTIEATDPTINLRYSSSVSAKNKARVTIHVTDVDEPPVFQKPFYHFQLQENLKKPLIGSVLAVDPDAARRSIGYFIRRTSDKGQFFQISKQGNIYNEKEVDREVTPWYNLTVEAKELDSRGEASSTLQLVVQILATDADITPKNVKFKFSLNTQDSNFTLTDNHDNTANITVKYGQFDREHTKVHHLPVLISDNGRPSLTGTSTLTVTVCKCNEHGEATFCNGKLYQGYNIIPVLVAIFLCILTITVIMVLLFLRRRLRKQDRAHGKSVPEIHEQLVSYDEEGHLPPPKPGELGDMAAVIEVKKDEADQDSSGLPYDTLHLFDYEGSESIAESLSSLGTGSSDSDIDYDFLNDWGPRFKMLAELYSTDSPEELLY